MRVFLDTNVLASAAATRGLCADVLREVVASHTFVTSEQVLAELRRVLTVKFGAPRHLADGLIDFLREDAVVGEPDTTAGALGTLRAVKLRHKADLRILAAAMAARPDVIITGDKELLGLRRIGPTVIISPRQFWERAGRSKPRRGMGRAARGR